MREPEHSSARATGPLASHLDTFVVSLIEQQYRASVTYVKAPHGPALDRWLAKRHVVLSDLSEVHIERYQNRCPRRRGSIRIATRQIERKAVTQLLEFLRARSVCPAAHIVTTAAEDLVAGLWRTRRGVFPADSAAVEEVFRRRSAARSDLYSCPIDKTIRRTLASVARNL